MKDVLSKSNIKYKEMKGEAAFYGPKIDIQVKTALGHSITMSTIQLDFLLPQKFDLKYIDKKGQQQTPVLIHRGLIGTYERFMSILLEQTKGFLPF
jgi:threonyl-tRNA synthetase